jgi:hypothetical protein
MVTSEFLVHFNSVCHQFHWRVTDDALLVPDRRQHPRFRIRATCPTLSEHQVFEPIGAVCYVQTGRIFDPDYWMDAADAIELSLIDAGDLTAAINDRTWDDNQGRRGPNPYRNQLREHLLMLTSLTAVAG